MKLTRERILETAAALADAHGIEAVTMRRIADELGVEAMSLYHHLRGKDDLLDALADWAFAEITLPASDRPWRAAPSA